MSGVAAAIARAVGFVESHGEEIDARASRAVADPARAPSFAEALAGRQRSDGSFAGGAAGLPATVDALGRLVDARVFDGPAVEGSCAFLAGSQHDDGSWSQRPGENERDTISLTGLVAGHLSRVRAASPRAVDSAVAFLAERFDPDLPRDSWAVLAGYAHTCANIDDDFRDAALQWCGRALEKGFHGREFGAVRTARILTWCGTPIFPGARIERDEVLLGLLAEQGSDGGFASDAAHPIGATLDAIAGLVFLG